MTVPGELYLVPFPRGSGLRPRVRPVVVLARLPGVYQIWLLAGVSTQFAGIVPGWDEYLEPSDPGFDETGLSERSAVRLSYLDSIEAADLRTRIGTLPPALLTRLQRRLAAWLDSEEATEAV